MCWVVSTCIELCGVFDAGVVVPYVMMTSSTVGVSTGVAPWVHSRPGEIMLPHGCIDVGVYF